MQDSAAKRASHPAVSFFVCGVQKAGTTALDKLLRLQNSFVQLPQIRKEIHFFDADSHNWDTPSYDALEHHFNASLGTICGECTPIYTYWPQAMERLQSYNPSARIIVLLRHPAYRALSQWRMEYARGNDTLVFAEAIRAAGRQRVQASANRVHRIYSYVERGFYDQQITRIQHLFPPDQILFLTTETMWTDPLGTLSKVLSFVTGAHVEQAQIFLPESLYAAPSVGAEPEIGHMNDADLHLLMDCYRDSIRRTAALTGLGLDHWLSPDYCEPMIRPAAEPRGAG